jgi:DNA-binding transcriptional regulator YiaG
MTVTEVEYRDVPGFPNCQVGSDGSYWRRIGTCRKYLGVPRRGPWVLAHATRMKTGHLRCQYRGENGVSAILVHRLVLLAFVGPCPPGMEGCHNDGNPANNRIENLRWDTHDANMKDAIRHGTARSARGEQQWQAKLTAEQVRYIRDNRQISRREMAKRFGIHPGTVKNIRRRATWAWLE